MSRPAKWIVGYLTVLFTITVLHFWLNLGFETLGLGRSENAGNQVRLRVGFLPVT